MTAPAFPAAILDAHTAVVAKTGGGKTYALKVLIEQAYDAGDHICVIDPVKSDHWGLTLAADGRSPGLPFHILGGPYGHVPLDRSAGAALGRLVGSGALRHSIIDMASFGMGDHQRFFIDFAEALFHAKTRSNGVLRLVLEEAHVFGPKERDGIAGENLAVYHIKKLATGARSKGVRLVVATQRTQSLHNAVLGSCDSVLAMRLLLPADQKPVLGWLKGSAPAEVAKAVEASLSSLPRGEGWLCSGEAALFQRFKVPRIRTYDNSGTPVHGAAADDVRPPAIDADELRAIVGAAVKDAVENDPKALKKRVAELEAELKRAGSEAVPAVATDAELRAEYERGFSAGQRGLFDLALEARNAVKLAAAPLRDLEHQLSRARISLDQACGRDEGPAPQPNPHSPSGDVPGAGDRPVGRAAELQPAVSAVTRPAGVADAPAGSGPGAGELGKGELAILTAIAQHKFASVELLTVLTGYKKSSRNTYLQKLQQRGLIVRRGDQLEATLLGTTLLGPRFKPLPTGDALREHWLRELSGGERVILQALCLAHPNGLAVTDLDRQTDYQKSSRNTYLQKLATRRLVERRSGRLFASPLLFGKGGRS